MKILSIGKVCDYTKYIITIWNRGAYCDHSTDYSLIISEVNKSFIEFFSCWNDSPFPAMLSYLITNKSISKIQFKLFSYPPKIHTLHRTRFYVSMRLIKNLYSIRIGLYSKFHFSAGFNSKVCNCKLISSIAQVSKMRRRLARCGTIVGSRAAATPSSSCRPTWTVCMIGVSSHRKF